MIPVIPVINNTSLELKPAVTLPYTECFFSFSFYTVCWAEPHIYCPYTQGDIHILLTTSRRNIYTCSWSIQLFIAVHLKQRFPSAPLCIGKVSVIATAVVSYTLSYCDVIIHVHIPLSHAHWVFLHCRYLFGELYHSCGGLINQSYTQLMMHFQVMGRYKLSSIR